ncbi:MAG: hypothetical protein MRY83_06395 [Flavobacteriales bacterium]|nr:hypothetical protein [Flavobacteriales bacterium]
MMKKLFIASIALTLLFYSCDSENKSTSAPKEDDNPSSNIGEAETSTHEAISLDKVIQEFQKCKENGGDKTRCKEYVSKAICGFYEITDFVKKDLPGGYLPYDDLLDYVSSSDSWEKLGRASKQSVLDEAQKRSNAMQATIAINDKEGSRNVAILVPGELTKSTSWKLNCPSVAMLFPNKPEKSFVGKTLNYAWSKPDNIVIYAKK